SLVYSIDSLRSRLALCSHSSTDLHLPIFLLFFFTDTATTEIYTLSLHDALPISRGSRCLTSVSRNALSTAQMPPGLEAFGPCSRDRKSTRLNSSHQIISYAVFCLKKKKKI